MKGAGVKVSRGYGSKVIRPRGDDYEEEWYDVLGYGGVSNGHSYEVTEDEERELRKERRRAQQKRKPLGFAPWPSND